MAYLSDAFVQLNTVKGYRFIDLAGKVMNRFDDQFPNKSVAVEGLKLAGGQEPLTEMEVSSERIWAHFANPGTTTLIIDKANAHLKEVSDILEVTDAKRFGFRTQWLSATPDMDSSFAAISGFALGDGLKSLFPGQPKGNLEFGWDIQDGLKVNFRLAPGNRLPTSPATIPATMIVLDLDVLREPRGEILPIREFRRFARTAAEVATAAVDRIEIGLGVQR